MIFSKIKGHESLRDCLLILTESCMRFLYLLGKGVTESREFNYLINQLEQSECGLSELHKLQLIEPVSVVGCHCSTSGFEIEKKGLELIEYAESDVNIDFSKLTVTPPNNGPLTLND